MLIGLPNSLTALTAYASQMRKLRLRKVEKHTRGSPAGIYTGRVLSTPACWEAVVTVCAPIYNLAQFPALGPGAISVSSFMFAY